MKKCFLVFGLLFALLLPSCSSNECVEQIVTILNKAAAEGAAEGGREASFARPGGNVFGNEAIKTIIKEHMGYKLTEKDKDMLRSAVNNLLPDNSALMFDQTGAAGRILIEMRSEERKLNMTKINDAKTLGDLL